MGGREGQATILVSSGDGDRVRYAIPFGPIGSLAHRLFVRRDLERIFDFRSAAVAELLRSSPA